MEKIILSLLQKEFPKFKNKKKNNLEKIKLIDIEGWDSLSSINFYLKLKKNIKIKIDIMKMFNLKTVNDLIVYINRSKK